MLCYKCGSHVPEGKKTCPTCGQSLARSVQKGSDSAADVVDDKRRARTSSRASAAIFSNGDVLSGRYRIIDPVGGGGVGAVYRAHDQDIDVDVALKTIAPKLLQAPEEKKVFSRKIRQARKLHHANIVRIYDEGQDGAHAFYTMQLLEGLTLRKVLDLRREKGQSFIGQEIAPIFRQLSAALEYAHRSTFHGGLKPENIIILPDLLKLTDFYLIQALPLKPFLAIQKAKGKAFHYIAPEVRLESNHVDGRADIYSMGVILMEMLTGEVFGGYWNKSVKDACIGIPPRVDALLRRALAEQPEARFQAVDDFMAGLEEILKKGDLEDWHEQSTAPSATPPPPPPPMADDDDDDVDEDDEPALLTGSSVLLIEDDDDEESTAVGVKRPQPEAERDDLTPIERPSTQDIETPPSARRRRGPPPLPPEDDDVDTAVERGAGEKDPAQAKLPDVVHKSTGLGPEVYDQATAIEDDLKPLPSADPDALNLGEDVPAPPPLPPDALAGFAEVGGDQTRSVPSEPKGIHDELTALSSYPEPLPGQLSGPLPTPLPRVLPPPLAPVLPPNRRRSSTRTLLFAGIGAVLFVLVGILLFSYIRDLQKQLAQQRVGQNIVDASLTGIMAKADAGSADLGSTTERAAAVEDANEPVQQLAQVDAASEAERLAEQARKTEEARKAEAQRLEDERKAKEARLAQEAADKARAEQEEAARLMREQAATAAAEKAARDSADKAERDRQRQEAKRLAAEARQRRQEEKQRKAAAEKARKAELARKRKEAEDKRKADEAAKAKIAAASSGGTSCPRGMKFIAAGAFKMGSAGNDPMRNFEEKRLESVQVQAFCMDYYEYPNGKRVKPRTGVTWYRAKSLCEAKGKRLCSEEEWEKACKGPKNLRYPYGNRWNPGVCNTEDAEGHDRSLAAPIDFPRCRSRYSIIGMSGNAAEWTSSRFSPGLRDRVHRGGSADKPNWASRCANRGNLAPGESNALLGFRCCADPK